MSDSIVVTSIFTDEETRVIEKYLDRIAVQSPVQPNHRCALGYAGPWVAAKIGPDFPAARLTGNTENDEAVLLITEGFSRVRRIIEDYYGKKLLMIHAIYTEISEGLGMGLHSDMYEVDGDLRDDNTANLLQYSAVLYLGTSGEDFTGGDLYFPNQDFRHKATRGSAIYFRGDLEHLHDVEPVTGGARKGITIFYGYKDKVLEAYPSANHGKIG